MKKYLCTVMTAVILACFLAGCGNKEAKEVTISPSDLAKQLTETVSSGTLSTDPVVSDILASTYFVDMDKVEESAAYMSTGATACEIAVVKCSDANYAGEVEKLFKTRVTNQSELFASYNAEEVKKLDAAITKVSGAYAVLCVTEDPKAAEKILSEAGF